MVEPAVLYLLGSNHRPCLHLVVRIAGEELIFLPLSLPLSLSLSIARTQKWTCCDLEKENQE